jgi:hypothetical protein
MPRAERFKLVWPETGVERIYEIPDENGDMIARWLTLFNEAGIEYAVGGAYAFHGYTGIWRDTKDFDVFLAPEDLKKALDALNGAYFHPDIRDAHWLAKVECTPYNLDLIFGFRNGQLKIDHRWFEYSRPVELAEVPTRLLAMEELIASKSYLAYRERFDGGDVAHLLREAKGKIDWNRLVERLGENRELLLWHFIFFLFVYPGHSDYIPEDVLNRLFDEIRERRVRATSPKAFRGFLLDRSSFEVDCVRFGYEDCGRGKPLVNGRGEAL